MSSSVRLPLPIAHSAFDLVHVPVHHRTARRVQPLLTANVPGDRHEQEADRISRQVAGSVPAPSPQLPAEPADARPIRDGVPAEVLDVVRSGGQPLDARTRAFMEARLGHDFSQVRVHADPQAGESARAMGARAYTVGPHVAFGAGQFAPASAWGRRVLAHELTHVVQQEGSAPGVQCYEAGEHAQLGETQGELKAATVPGSYVVRKGDRLPDIAANFGLTPEELKAANPDKLKRWPSREGGRPVEGFEAGVVIAVPQRLNEATRAAVGDQPVTFVVNGVALEYGVGIAMGDLFESPEQMAAAPPAEIKELAELIRRERAGKSVSTEEWEKATGGKYLKLAEKNRAHFAPSNPALVPPTHVGRQGPDHRTEWEKHHAAALKAAEAGQRDEALRINSFGDHFLTDAFAAGHLVNKADVMEKFKGQLTLDKSGEKFTPTSAAFFDAVANDAFTGDVAKEFSSYETVEFKGVVFRPDIDSAGRFSALLQAIHMKEPDLLANAVAKGVHDRLNTLSGGLPVENNKGDRWELSGDGTLNARSREVALKAVAQSQINVLSAVGLTGLLDLPELFRRVWDYTPRTDPAGAKQVVSAVNQGTDINSPALRAAVVGLIKANYKTIIAELVKRKILKRA